MSRPRSIVAAIAFGVAACVVRAVLGLVAFSLARSSGYALLTIIAVFAAATAVAMAWLLSLVAGRDPMARLIYIAIAVSGIAVFVWPLPAGARLFATLEGANLALPLTSAVLLLLPRSGAWFAR